MQQRSKEDHVRLYLESQTIQNKKDYPYQAKNSWWLGHEGLFSLRQSALVKLGKTGYVLTRMLHGST